MEFGINATVVGSKFLIFLWRNVEEEEMETSLLICSWDLKTYGSVSFKGRLAFVKDNEDPVIQW